MVFINLVAPTSTNFAGSPFQIFVGAATRAKGAAASRLTVDRFKFSCAIIRLNTRGDLEVSFTGERDTGAPSIKRGFAIENGASARFSPSLLSFEPSTDLLSRYRRISLLAPIFISPRSRIRGIRDRNRYYAEGCNDCLEGERERGRERERLERWSVTSLSISTFLSIKGRKIYERRRVGDRGGCI